MKRDDKIHELKAERMGTSGPMARRREAERLREAAALEQERAMQALAHLKTQYRELIESFMVLAERKVSLLDEYGDERWDALPRLVAVVVSKIAAREGGPKMSPREWERALRALQGRDARPGGRVSGTAYISLARELEADFRERHKRGTAKKGDAENFNTLSGSEFEALVARLLQRKGFVKVRGTPTTGDQGADLLAARGGRQYVIQVKRQVAPVGNRAVQEVAAALLFYGGDEAWVMTNSRFTASAHALAQKTGVKLVVVRGGRSSS